jgi:dienelactone hydrolase
VTPSIATVAGVAASLAVTTPDAAALPEPLPLERIEGIYAADGAPRLWIGPFPELGGDPFFLDFATLRFGPLRPGADGELVSGPALGAAEPGDLTIRFDLAPDGSVALARWTLAGGRAGAARRAAPRTEEVGFANGEVTLAGTLVLPAGAGPHPAVVLLHGSGPLDRRWLRLWADLFAHSGSAALVYDKRGTGGSTGDWRHADLPALAGDAAAAFDLLRARRDVDPRRIGLWGISQGGWLAPLVAAERPEVAFVVLHAGPATTGAEQVMEHLERELRAAGLAGADLDGPLGVARRSLDYDRRPDDAAWRAYEAAHAAESARGAPWVPPFARRDAWLRGYLGMLLDFDPKPWLERLRVPLLAFFGELDTNVPPASNRPRLEAALAVAGHRDATIVTLPRANHLFLEAATGAVGEIPSLSRFVPGYFEVTLDWLRARTAAGTAGAEN